MSASTRTSGSIIIAPLVCGALLGLMCFQLPGREGPETVGAVDTVALLKMAVRLGTSLLLLGVLCANWQHPRRPLVVATLAPLGLFVLWAISSASWSALKTVSLGQVLGLLDLYLIAATIALLWRGPQDTSRILCVLVCSTFVFSSILVVADTVSHDISGLNREDWSDVEGSTGIVHPTTAGATASIGLALLLGCWLHGGWRWPRVMLVPGVIIYVTMLTLAASRTAMAMAAVTSVLFFLTRARPAAIAAAVLSAAVLGTIVLLVDPGFSLFEAIEAKVAEKLSRGESAESLHSLTGRTDLWDAIWNSYYDSPIIGHGYFVTSRIGEIDVWSGPANRTAHNTLLQVLVTTGAIGLLLFIVGLAWPIALAVKSYARKRLDDDGRRLFPKELASLLVIIALWYVGWGQLSESFMGPINPESVVFFSLLGIMIAQIDPALVTRPARRRAMARVEYAGGRA